MTTQDVDPKTYYAVGNGLYEKAGKLYDAFSVNVKILGETGSMAGTDDAGTAWAASYDTRVGEVLGAVNDLTAAMQNYGGVIIQAGYNHAVAEHDATPGQQGPAAVKPAEPSSVAGCLAAPPSAGGSGKGLLDDAIGLVEQLGVPVPDGDTDKIAASFVSFGAGAVAGTAKAAQSIKKFAGIITEAIGAWKITRSISKGVESIEDIVGVRSKLQRLKSLGRKRKPEEPPLGTGVQRVPETPLTTSRAQIEKKFDKHAEDFGITEPRGKAGFDQLEQAIRAQIDDPATIHVNGTYRGDAAIINYSPDTGLAVVQRPSGEFVSGWRLSPDQVANVLQRGSLR